MSSEGRKKRGLAGQANAAANPFRMNGWSPDWYARKLGCHYSPPAPSSGSVTMRGFVGGSLAAAMGYPMRGDDARYDRMIIHAQTRVTHPVLRLDDEESHKIAAE